MNFPRKSNGRNVPTVAPPQLRVCVYKLLVALCGFYFDLGMKCVSVNQISPTMAVTTVNKAAPAEKLKPKYGKILLTLQNCLLSEDKLNATPSSLDGLDAETETDLRILGCELIQTAGILLKLPQVSILIYFINSKIFNL